MMRTGAQSSMKSVPAIAFEVRASRALAGAGALVTVCALIAIAACGLRADVKLLFGVLVFVYAGISLRRFLASAYVHAAWLPAGHWRLRTPSGVECGGELQRAVVLGAAIVLHLRVAPKQTCVLVLLPDNCDAETRRRLRVRLMRADSIHVAP